MNLLIKVGVQNSCTPISLFVHPTLPVKGYKKKTVKNFSGHTIMWYNTDISILTSLNKMLNLALDWSFDL